MGDTGYTFGAHLHFQIIQNGKTINPLPYLKGEKQIQEYIENNYAPANYIVLTDVLNVRRGPGKNYDIVRYPDLTRDAKRQMSSYINCPANGYVKGMEFTALTVQNMGNEKLGKNAKRLGLYI